MAVRIRANGTIVCAALRPAEPGDTYIDDGLHYELSVVRKLLVCEPAARHRLTALWWWVGVVPPDVNIDPFYLQEEHGAA